MLICSSPAFPVGGNVFHGKKLSVIKTEYFDIIFSDDCIVSAKKIASVADGYYAEISQRMGLTPYQHFPVVLTREVESPNGFFSPAPFNTIVLYESVFDNPLDTFSSTIESVFYHELTHAVTLNDKAVFWRGMSFFGDFMNPAYLSASYFWIEGVSVLFESTISSDYGEGRLCNPYFTQLVSEAKAEMLAGKKKFPSWRDVAGSRDIFPSGATRYAFGACFAQFLIEKYGMESYQQFWHKCGTFTTLSFIAGIFKRTYGTKLDDSWKEFIDWIPCVIDEKAFSGRKVVSDKRAAVKALDSFFDRETGLRKTVWFDSKSSRVIINDGSSTRTLFPATGVSRLVFSDDGSKIAVTRTVSHATVKSEAGIYDLRKKKYSVVQKKGAAEAFFRGGDIDFVSIEKQIDEEDFIHSPLSVRLKSGAHLDACVVKRGLDWKIRVGECAFSVGEKRIVHNMHFEGEEDGFVSFCFTYSDTNGLSGISKIGRIRVSLDDFSARIYLQKNNGFSPFIDVVPADGNTGGADFFVVAAEYESNPLYKVSFSEDDFEVTEVFPSAQEKIYAELPEATDDGGFAFSIEPYSRFSYALKGTKLPVGLVPVVNSEFEFDSVAFIGASYLTSSPWLNNFFLVSGGFDPFYKDGGILLGLYGFDSAIDYQLFGTILFNSGGFMQTYERYSLSAYLFRGLSSTLKVGAYGEFIYGKDAERDTKVQRYVYEKNRRNGKVVSYSAKEVREGVFADSDVYIQFSCMQKTGPSINDVLEFSFKPFFKLMYSDYTISYDYESMHDNYDVKRKYMNFGGTVGFRFPGISAGSLGSIFPLSLQATLFPSNEYVLSAFARLTLLSVEIQKGIPALSLYATRASVFAGYSSYFSHFSNNCWDIKKTFDILRDLSYRCYSDIVTLGVNVILNPNTGALADPSLQFSLGANFNYYPTPETDSKWSIDLFFGILNFSKRKTFE